jgi:hypothetical protein
MDQLLKMPEFWIVIGIAALLCLAAVGYYVIQKVRSDAYSRGIFADSEVLTSVSDLYDQGDLTDEEYKKIKGMLRDSIQKQVNDPPTTKPTPPENPLFPKSKNPPFG